MSFSASDATAQTAAKAASRALSQASRAAANDRAGAGSFDDLLKSIPDAPPEPRAQARADSPADRPRPAETRSTARSDRPERSDRRDNKAKADAPATAETSASDSRTAPQDTTAKAGTDARTAGTETSTPVNNEGQTDTKAVETDTAAPSAETEATVTALAAQIVAPEVVPQAVVLDPAATPVTTDPAADAEQAFKAAPDQAATAPAAPATEPVSEQQAAALADQTTGLTADDAEALSALAVKAQQSFKDAQGDKTARKAASDKPTEAVTLDSGNAASTDTNAQAQASAGEGDKAGEKPVQSDLMKVAAEHHRSPGNSDAKPASDLSAPNANAGGAAAKADALPSHGFAATLQQTHAATASAAAGRPSQAVHDDTAVPVGNVAVEVTAKIAAGKNQFDIRLDPEELGRIHVKVNVDRDGNITTHMLADRPETLDLLRREVQGLERALQDAGLKTSDNGLQFSLRDQSAQQQQERQEGHANRVADDDDQSITTPVTIMARDYGRYSARPSGVDIRV